MSGPSFSNIDRWLFELVEGNLTQEQIAQLKIFLMNHPELDVDVDTWNLAKVENEPIVYPHQKQLERRRPIGLYMSLGLSSIAILIGLGVYTNLNPLQNQDSVLTSEADLVVKEDLKEFSRNTVKESNARTENNVISNESSLNNVSLNETEGIVQYQVMTPENSFNQSEFRNEIRAQHVNEFTETAQSEIEKIDNISEKPVLKSEPTKEIKTSISNKDIVYRSMETPRGNKFVSSNYHMSFSSRVAKLGRSMQRMMDNPVALRNSRDPYYHVPGMQATDINFGAVGTLVATRIQTVSRAQWYGESNQHLMNQLSVDGYSYGIRGGIGFQLNHNFYGTGGIENYQSSISYSPKFSVTKNIMVEPSVRFKMGNKKLYDNQMTDIEYLEYDRMNQQSYYPDGSTPIGKSLWYKDLGLGMMVNTKWFFAGIQGDNLLKHDEFTFTNDKSVEATSEKHFIATIGTDYQTKKENLGVSTYLVYQNKGTLSEAWLGAQAHYNWLTFGGAISSNLEPSVSLGMKFDHFMLSYNADLVNSRVLGSSSLSHQLTIRFLTKPGRVGQRLLNQ